jgi:ketosteroid isomerase-like protein
MGRTARSFGWNAPSTGMEISARIDLRTSSGLVSDTPMPGATNRPLNLNRHRMAHGLMLAALCVPALGASAAQTTGAAAHPKGPPGSHKHEHRHEIDQLEDQWRNALMSSNTAQMEKLLANDYQAITASGTLQTRDEALASLKSGQTHITTLDISDRKVRFYGTTALVTSLAEVQGTTADGDLSGSYRYTHVYVRDAQGAWKIVNFEASRIREPGEHK